MTKKKEMPEPNADLDQLRNILYGNQARATEQRLTDLEARLETVRSEMSDDLNDRAASLSGTASSQLAETRQALGDQLAQVTADFNQRLDKHISNLSQRLSEFRTEARQRDDDLRQEMLALGVMLDKQKTGREELGELLVQLGQQLQENGAAPSPETED